MSAPPPPAPAASVEERTRTRLVWTMFGFNALSSTAFIGAVTVAPLIGEGLLGSARLAGLPSTAATVGTAAGSILLGSLGARRGRRPTFGGGFALAAAGAAGAALSAVAGSFLGFALSLAVLGFGRSASQLARYAAGDLRVEARRGRAISLVVWASTIGAVAGPLLVGVAGRRAGEAGLDPDLGPLVLGGALFAVAALVVVVALRPDPLSLAVREPAAGPPRPTADIDVTTLRALFARPTVRLSMAVLVTSQLVMVLVMTMTPIHIRDAGDTLDVVGQVMAGHTLGMFALAPLTGLLVDRVGARRVMALGGGVLLVSCVVAALADGTEGFVLHVALFGLGYGWNLGFVSASTHLQHGLAIDERARIQGVADAATWLAGGLGAAVSGLVVAGSSYAWLGTSGAALSLAVPLALVAARRQARAA